MPKADDIRGWIIAVDRVINGRKGVQSYAVGIPDQDLALAAMRKEVGGDYPLRVMSSFDTAHAEKMNFADGDVKQVLALRSARLN